MTPHAPEIATDDDRLAYLANRQGLLADALGEGDLGGSDLELLRSAIIGAAVRVLTPDQLQVFALYLCARRTPTDIAKLTGRSQPAVHIMLHGRQGTRAQRGILDRVTAELAQDEEFKHMAKRIRSYTASPVGPGLPDIARWFQNLPVGRPDHFVARAALLAFVAIADRKKRLTIEDAYQVLPRPVVTAALPLLKVSGFVRTDGRTIEIIRTPVPEEENADVENH